MNYLIKVYAKSDYDIDCCSMKCPFLVKNRSYFACELFNETRLISSRNDCVDSSSIFDYYMMEISSDSLSLSTTDYDDEEIEIEVYRCHPCLMSEIPENEIKVFNILSDTNDKFTVILYSFSEFCLNCFHRIDRKLYYECSKYNSHIYSKRCGACLNYISKLIKTQCIEEMDYKIDEIRTY